MNRACLLNDRTIAHEVARLLHEATRESVSVTLGDYSCSLAGDPPTRYFSVESETQGKWKDDLGLSLDAFKAKHLDELVKKLLN